MSSTIAELKELVAAVIRGWAEGKGDIDDVMPFLEYADSQGLPLFESERAEPWTPERLEHARQRANANARRHYHRMREAKRALHAV